MSPGLTTIVTYGRMIKLSHSIFAMPFALAAAVLAGGMTPMKLVLIVACMVLARSTAMGVNRVVDREYDAQNPRTAIREIPSGLIPVGAARLFTGIAAVLFVVCAFALDPVCGYLSPVALGVICGYSYAKRFTALVHLWLGVALGLAPIAVWIALTGTLSAVPVVLAFAVATWVAGFDILYSLQDDGFDKEHGLHSIPVALGRTGALWVSGGLHLVTVAALAMLPSLVVLAWPYWIGWGVITTVLTYEHWLVRPHDLSRIDKAFFDLNGYVSLFFFAAVLISR